MSSLPFAISCKNWHDLEERERSFFADENVLHPERAKQIWKLELDSAETFTKWAFRAIPAGFLNDGHGYSHQRILGIQDTWNDKSAIQKVREWLFTTGIAFDRDVYLIYERNCTIKTKWKFVVRYWDQFAWSVGYAMICVDHSQQWACCFHHEDVIIFGCNFAIT